MSISSSCELRVPGWMLQTSGRRCLFVFPPHTHFCPFCRGCSGEALQEASLAGANLGLLWEGSGRNDYLPCGTNFLSSVLQKAAGEGPGAQLCVLCVCPPSTAGKEPLPFLSSCQSLSSPPEFPESAFCWGAPRPGKHQFIIHFNGKLNGKFNGKLNSPSGEMQMLPGDTG